jgi:hypothetical protein
MLEMVVTVIRKKSPRTAAIHSIRPSPVTYLVTNVIFASSFSVSDRRGLCTYKGVDFTLSDVTLQKNVHRHLSLLSFINIHFGNSMITIPICTREPSHDDDMPE